MSRIVSLFEEYNPQADRLQHQVHKDFIDEIHSSPGFSERHFKLLVRENTVVHSDGRSNKASPPWQENQRASSVFRRDEILHTMFDKQHGCRAKCGAA